MDYTWFVLLGLKKTRILMLDVLAMRDPSEKGLF
jgi:hypothetical protein